MIILIAFKSGTQPIVIIFYWVNQQLLAVKYAKPKKIVAFLDHSSKPCNNKECELLLMFGSKFDSMCKAAPTPFLRKGDRCTQAISLVAQKQSVLLAPAPCACYSISHLPLALFSLLCILHFPLPKPPSLSFFHWRSVWKVPGSIGLGAYGWKGWIYQSVGGGGGRGRCVGAGFGKKWKPLDVSGTHLHYKWQSFKLKMKIKINWQFHIFVCTIL